VGREERGERGRVQEGALGHVDDDAPLGAIESVEEPRLQVGSDIEIDLALHVDHEPAAGQLLGGHAEVCGH